MENLPLAILLILIGAAFGALGYRSIENEAIYTNTAKIQGSVEVMQKLCPSVVAPFLQSTAAAPSSVPAQNTKGK